MRARLVVLTAVVALLPACALFAGSVPDAADGDWQLTQGSVGGDALQVPDGVRITMSIDGSEIGGNNSCNSYFGTIETSAGRLSITELGQTEMACPDVTDLEATYMQALQAVTALEVTDGDLRLTGPDVDLRFARVEPVPTADLVGTSWTLESLIEGDAASSVGGDPAILELSDDRQLNGSTGCRSFVGSYQVTGDTVTITELATDDRACPAELQQQDDHVLAVLGDGFTVRIEQDRLTVTSAGDRTLGLDYRAT